MTGLWARSIIAKTAEESIERASDRGFGASEAVSAAARNSSSAYAHAICAAVSVQRAVALEIIDADGGVKLKSGIFGDMNPFSLFTGSGFRFRLGQSERDANTVSFYQTDRSGGLRNVYGDFLSCIDRKFLHLWINPHFAGLIRDFGGIIVKWVRNLLFRHQLKFWAHDESVLGVAFSADLLYPYTQWASFNVNSIVGNLAIDRPIEYRRSADYDVWPVRFSYDGVLEDVFDDVRRLISSARQSEDGAEYNFSLLNTAIGLPDLKEGLFLTAIGAILIFAGFLVLSVSFLGGAARSSIYASDLPPVFVVGIIVFQFGLRFLLLN